LKVINKESGNVKRDMVCIICPNSCEMIVKYDDSNIEVKGNKCSRGRDFAIKEIRNPMRSICSTVRTVFEELPRIPVKTDGEVPLNMTFQVMDKINNVVVDRILSTGDIVLENVLGLNVNVVLTSDMLYLIKGKFGAG